MGIGRNIPLLPTRMFQAGVNSRLLLVFHVDLSRLEVQRDRQPRRDAGGRGRLLRRPFAPRAPGGVPPARRGAPGAAADAAEKTGGSEGMGASPKLRAKGWGMMRRVKRGHG